MSLPRSELVVLASRRAEAAAVLGVLQDWSALGLIGDFVYIDVDRSPRGLGSWCAYVSGGLIREGVLHDVLARRTQTRAVRVVCLSQVSDTYSTVGNEGGGAIRQEVANALPAAQVTWIHAIAVSVPHVWPQVSPGDLAWIGAHNVVLAPENSQSPTAGVAPIETDVRLAPLGLTHQAAALCSAVGLWDTEPRTFFDGETGGGQLVALRTFTRHIALEKVRSRVLAKLVDVNDGYPVPVDAEGRILQLTNDETGASQAMVEALLRAHPEIGRTRRAEVSPIKRLEIGVLEAVRRFLRFFAGVLRGAPRQLLNQLEHQASQRAAIFAQGLLFGGDRSAYVVTVNGIRGVREDGTPATPTQVDEDIDRLLVQVGGPEANRGERQEYPVFWHHFVDGALTLLDGSPRDEALPPPRVGVGVALVNRPGMVAPDPDDRYRIEPALRAVAKVDEIPPYDQESAKAVYRMLGEEASAHPERASSLLACQEQLKDWFDQRSRSYVGGLGKKLSADLDVLRDEVTSYAAELRAGRDDTSLAEEHGVAQRALARTMLSVTALFALLAVAVNGLAYFEMLPWRLSLAALPVIGGIWLLGSTMIFTRRQQHLYQLLHQRGQAAQRLAQVKENLRAALIDLRRLRGVYRQYLSWAQAMGSFVRAPLGRVEQSDDRVVALGEGFGLNHRFGLVVPDDSTLDDMSRQIQAELFKVGWLTSAWNDFLLDLPDFKDRHLVEADTELLFNDRPVSEDSVLAQWSDAVRDQDRTDAAGEIARRLDDRLSEQRGPLFQRLLRTIRSTGPNSTVTDTTYDDFVAGLEQVSDGPCNGQFSRRIFATVPQTSEPWLVKRALVNGRRESGRMLIVTQRTDPFTAQDLVFSTTRGGPARPGSIAEPSAPPQV